MTFLFYKTEWKESTASTSEVTSSVVLAVRVTSSIQPASCSSRRDASKRGARRADQAPGAPDARY